MTTENITITDPNGDDWNAHIEYDEVCLRQGNYSSAAMDPDEYFGIYRFDLVDVHWIEFNPPANATRDPDEDDRYELIEEDIPDWAYDAAQEWCEDQS